MDKDATIWTAFLSTAPYKKNQARLVRSLTLAGLLAVVGIGAWVLHQSVFTDSDPQAVRFGVPLLVAAVGAWLSYRVVHYPAFANFLIDVESELAKVNWPAKTEVYRATIVVIAVMFMLSLVLFMYDVLWQQILRFLQVLRF